MSASLIKAAIRAVFLALSYIVLATISFSLVNTEMHTLARIEQSTVGNLLLRRLVPDEFAALRPTMERVPLARNEVVIQTNVPFEYAYFPEGGLASVISNTEDGRRLEVGLFGREATVSGRVHRPEQRLAAVTPR